MYNIHNIHVCVVAQNQANVAIFSIGTMTKVWYDFRKIITILLNNSRSSFSVATDMHCTYFNAILHCKFNYVIYFFIQF